MSKDIKTKFTVKDIKILDKAVIANDKIKNVSTKTKSTVEDNQNSTDVNPTRYATTHVSNKSSRVANKSAIESKVRVNKVYV